MAPDSNGELRGAAQTSTMRRRQEIEQRDADLQAFGAALFALSSPDQLRNLVGRENVLRLAAYAGIDPSGMQAGWDEQDRKVHQQASIKTGESWQEAVDHDPRVVAAMGLEPDGQGGVIQVGPGKSTAEITRISKQVAAEHAERARERERAADRPRQPSPGGITASGSLADAWRSVEGFEPPRETLPPPPIGVRQDPATGVPLQQSYVDRSVAELGAEKIGPTPMSDVRQVVITCTQHAGDPSDKFCGVCGRARPEVRA